MQLADWLKRERLTHDQFAVLLSDADRSVDRSTVTRWLPGDDGSPPKRRPGWDLLARILEVTKGDVTPNDFLIGDQDVAA